MFGTKIQSMLCTNLPILHHTQLCIFTIRDLLMRTTVKRMISCLFPTRTTNNALQTTTDRSNQQQKENVKTHCHTFACICHCLINLFKVYTLKHYTNTNISKNISACILSDISARKTRLSICDVFARKTRFRSEDAY